MDGKVYLRSSLFIITRIALFMLIFVFTITSGLERKLSYALNPGCGNKCNISGTIITVVHVSAVGPNDTLHYIWDFVGKPSILVALATHNANLSFNWDGFINGKGNTVTFSEQPKYTFGVVLNKLIEFNDVNDIGRVDVTNMNDSYVRHLYTEYFNWTRSSLVQDEEGVVLNIDADGFYYNETFTRRGRLRIKLDAFGLRKHSKELPRLLHTANSTVIDFEIDGFETEPNFSSSRFGVEILLASSDNCSNNMVINERESLDDEQSPGVFTLVDLLTPSSDSGAANGGFLQWRPVAYIARARSLTNSTETLNYNVTEVDDPITTLNNTLLHSYYGSRLVNEVLVRETIVTFGLKEDGFFKKTNYTSWAFTVGYGKPPSETFSLLVILIISIGLGLPALLIVISGIVFGVRRITHKKDELCLSR